MLNHEEERSLTEGDGREMGGFSAMLNAEMDFGGIGHVLDDDDRNECTHQDRGDPQHVRPEETSEQRLRFADPTEIMGRRMVKPLLDHFQSIVRFLLLLVAALRWREHFVKENSTRDDIDHRWNLICFSSSRSFFV